MSEASDIESGYTVYFYKVLVNQGMKIKIEQSQIFVIQYFRNYEKIQIIP